MRKLIALKAFGSSELDAVRRYTAMLMAERGIMSAPNMAIGAPFNIGGVQPGRARAHPPTTPGTVGARGAYQGLSVPPTDRIWRRHRTEADVPEKLGQRDVQLVGLAQEVAVAAAKLDLEA